MRDTSSDMMEDAMSEDTMMDCGVDTESMDALGDLSTEIPNSTSIRDAAERLLTLLGIDELDDDFLSSSEDEGVEVDLDDNEDDEDDDDDDDGPPNSRLLHQLAATLAEELKYAQLQSNNINGKNNSQCNRVIGTSVDINGEQIQRMDITYSDDTHQIIRGQSSIIGNKFGINYYENYQCEENSGEKQEIIHRILDNKTNQSRECDDFFVSNKRCRIDECRRIIDEQKDKTIENCETSSLWAAGWDSCAAEAVRYLIVDEGLDPTHPTVLALKSHLEVQRNRALLQYTT